MAQSQYKLVFASQKLFWRKFIRQDTVFSHSQLAYYHHIPLLPKLYKPPAILMMSV